MLRSLTTEQLELYCLRLLASHLPDGYSLNYSIAPFITIALQRIECCFGHVNLKYYRENGDVVFNHLNSDHFATFLYFLGNTIWNQTNDTELPTRFFYLNKIMHGLDLFYAINMPKIFLLVHPIGTVLGNANYDDYFVAYQNVTVGADEAGIYPSFEIGAVLYAKSTVIGECQIGKNVVFGANAFVINTDVPDQRLVVGQHPNCRTHPNLLSTEQRIFNKKI